MMTLTMMTTMILMMINFPQALECLEVIDIDDDVCECDDYHFNDDNNDNDIDDDTYDDIDDD